MLVLLLAVAAVPAQPMLKPACQEAGPQRADVKRPTRPRKLNEEPAAVPIYTVQRTVGGCTRPVPVGSLR